MNVEDDPPPKRVKDENKRKETTEGLSFTKLERNYDYDLSDGFSMGRYSSVDMKADESESHYRHQESSNASSAGEDTGKNSDLTAVPDDSDLSELEMEVDGPDMEAVDGDDIETQPLRKSSRIEAAAVGYEDCAPTSGSSKKSAKGKQKASVVEYDKVSLFYSQHLLNLTFFKEYFDEEVGFLSGTMDLNLIFLHKLTPLLDESPEPKVRLNPNFSIS